MRRPCDDLSAELIEGAGVEFHVIQGWLKRARPLNVMLRLLSWIGLALAVVSASSAWAQINEADVKAAMVFNLSRFATWPNQQLKEDFKLCVFGKGELADSLMLLKGKQIQSVSLLPRQVDQTLDFSGCQVLYLAPSKALLMTEVIQDLNQPSKGAILSISDSPGFAMRGGMVELMVLDGKVQFVVNYQALQQKELSLHARVLQLAREILR